MYLDFSASSFKITSQVSFARFSIALPALLSTFFIFLDVMHEMFMIAYIEAKIASPIPACNKAKISKKYLISIYILTNVVIHKLLINVFKVKICGYIPTANFTLTSNGPWPFYSSFYLLPLEMLLMFPHLWHLI